jgi:hypothetical protein
VILRARDIQRIGLTPCGSMGIGELDCLFCALRCLHARQGNTTLRDAHVWLYWAGMPCLYPTEVSRGS